jgi:hypothetical protein
LKFWYDVGKTALATTASGGGEVVVPSTDPVPAPPPQADSHTTSKITPQRSMSDLQLKMPPYQTTNHGVFDEKCLNL